VNTFPIQLVSLGPGDPELITVKALKALQAADCIFCPETRDRRSRSADIVQQLGIKADAIRRYSLEMSKQRQKAQTAYEEIGRRAALLQNSGQRVCIVAEGDAGLYSSVHYILERLEADGLPVEQIAGVPAFIAAAAKSHLHIAKQEERLTVIPGTATTNEIERLMESGGTAVIMKLSQCAEAVLNLIMQHPEYAYHYYEHLGMPEELCLNEPSLIAARPFPYFSMLIVQGE